MTVVQIVNTEQASAWDGHEGDVWTEQADRYDRAAGRHLQRFVDAGVVARTDDVLDVGCGTGQPTRAAARLAVEGSALGIDLSTRMLELARQRSTEEGLTNISFVRGDAQVHGFEPASADVVMSSFGCMFFGDPVAAFSNLHGALRGGGRLALLAWRDLTENEWLMELRGALALGRTLPFPPPGAPTPFSLADPAIARRVLGEAGFVDVVLDPIDEPMDLGDDVDDAYAFACTMGIVEGLLDGCDEGQRAEGLAGVRRVLEAHASPAGVLIGSASWLITARA